jgi:hypothetical protein
MTRRCLSGALLALALPLLGLAAAPAAVAVTGSPPVTVPDTAAVFPGGVAELDPTANDQDPDGDRVAICRMGDEHYRKLGVEIDPRNGRLFAFAKPSAKPGDYTFTYLACDYSYLVPGTITITVEKAPHVRVHEVAGRAGRFRVSNPAVFPIRFLYGSPKAQRPDGSVRVGAHHSKVVRIGRPSFIWVAITIGRFPSLVDQGHVSDDRAGRAAPHRHVPITSRKAFAWLAG